MVRATLKMKFRQLIAWMFVVFCLVSCGGGGSSPTTQPPVGGTPPPGGSPPPGPTTTVPQFTGAFAQFLGTPSATAAADLDGDARYDGGFYDEAGGAGGRGIMANRGFKTTWDKDNKRNNESLGMSREELAAAVKKGDWNSMVLTAKGNTMRIALNGKVLGELIDNSPKAVNEGVIAFQMHAGYTMTIQFKDVKIKLLTP